MASTNTETPGSTSGIVHSTCVPHELELGTGSHPCGAPTSSSNSPLVLLPLRRAVPSLLLSDTANQRPTAALLLNQNFFSSSGCSHECHGLCTSADCSRKRNSCCYLKLIPLSLLVYSVLSLGVFFSPQQHSAETFSCESRSHLRRTNRQQQKGQLSYFRNGGRTLLNAASQANPGTQLSFRAWHK